jgi:signal peptide peptidase SppA
MKLLDIVNSAWAIEPSKLQEIAGIYATHLRGEKIDVASVEARLGRPLANESRPYEILDGVAVISIEGVMAKRANLMMQISGGVSTQLIARDLRAAADDPAVHSIILSIDSPGGTVDGTQTLADLVAQINTTKPVVSLASGSMASAAYWVGSAASRVFVAESTTLVGSIGVVATHLDISKAEELRGVKTTEIVAGAYKRIASQYAPLTSAGRQSMQDQVDYTYSLFVEAVARQRGVSADKVLSDMADGRVFMGQQAIDAGLVDGVSTLNQLVELLNQERAGVASSGPRVIRQARLDKPTSPEASNEGRTMPLTLEQVKAEAPDVAAALAAEGAAAERQRIQQVEAQLLPGHEALINTLKFDGKSSGGDAAMAVLAADKAARTAQAQAISAEAPSPVAGGSIDPAVELAAGAASNEPQLPTRTADGLPISAERAALHAKAQAYMSANPGTSYLDAVKHIEKGA